METCQCFIATEPLSLESYKEDLVCWYHDSFISCEPLTTYHYRYTSLSNQVHVMKTTCCSLECQTHSELELFWLIWINIKLKLNTSTKSDLKSLNRNWNLSSINCFVMFIYNAVNNIVMEQFCLLLWRIQNGICYTFHCDFYLSLTTKNLTAKLYC